MRAARALSDRVSGREILRTKTTAPIRGSDEDSGPGWYEEFASNFSPDIVEDAALNWDQLSITIRNLWELECLVNALDAIETLSSLAGLTREYVQHFKNRVRSQTNPAILSENANSREVWAHAGQQIRLAKECMKPILKGWLLRVNDSKSNKLVVDPTQSHLLTTQPDPDDSVFTELRAAYIPETVMAFVSSLHFIGTSLTRDNLLECMELAAVIAEKGSDVAQEFIKCGRMKELLEAFASCSKALAIWTSDKKSAQPSSKKMREMGWSRELWTVKP